MARREKVLAKTAFHLKLIGRRMGCKSPFVCLCVHIAAMTALFNLYRVLAPKSSEWAGKFQFLCDFFTHLRAIVDGGEKENNLIRLGLSLRVEIETK